MTPRGFICLSVVICHTLKVHHFFYNLFPLLPGIDQTNCIVKMNKECSTNIVNIMTPGEGVHVLGRGHLMI